MPKHLDGRILQIVKWTFKAKYIIYTGRFEWSGFIYQV